MSEVQSASQSKKQSEQEGTFIVIEGTEGSGKATQLRMLAEQLEAAGHRIVTIDFPQYDEPSSIFIKKYRHGDYGDMDTVSPYGTSLFYALDQFDAAQTIRQALGEGKVVLCNHFVASNMARQGVKIQDVEKRRGFYIWLDNLEFDTLNIPRPNLNIILRIPAELSSTKVKTVEAYDDLSKLFPKDFSRIDCVRGGELLTAEAIHALVSEKVSSLLPETPAPAPSKTKQHAAAISEKPNAVQQHSLPEFVVPDNLDKDTRRQYVQTITDILETHSLIEEKLGLFLHDEAQARQLARLVLPIAADTGASCLTPNDADSDKLAELVASTLPTHHVDGTDDNKHSFTLLNVSPRNELDLVADILYTKSDLPFADILARIDQLTYEDKLNVLEAAKRSTSTLDIALSSVRYTWDMMTSYAAYCNLLAIVQPESLHYQAITPRHGYDVPDAIEDAGLTDEFEACFDASLKLYSQLQHKGYNKPNILAHAVLNGHRIRWQATYTGRLLRKMFSESSQSESKEVRLLLEAVQQSLNERHPMLADAIAEQEKH